MACHRLLHYLAQIKYYVLNFAEYKDETSTNNLSACNICVMTIAEITCKNRV